MSYKFIQMSDPQLGFYASRHPETEGIDFEIKNLSKAIEITNKISPDFVITTGDLMQDRLASNHVDIIKKMYSDLNCKYYFAPGNADLTNNPEFDDIERYKKRFGLDHQSFYHMNSQFIILNSCVLQDWSKVSGEDSKQIKFLEYQLQNSKKNKSLHKFIFMHHPLFGTNPEEEDGHMVLPKVQRRLILNLLDLYKVSAVFTGHWHANNILNYNNTQLITSGPISFSLGEDPSGIRLIEVDDDKLTHEYIEL
tara:strand:+ start:403 stop:1158 length:756 start_codon:yes stop_codon:yes gene_type:complete